RSVTVGEHVARNPVVRERDGRGRGAVVDLVDPRGRHRQGPGRDVRGGAGRGVDQVVVGRVRAAEADAVHADSLAGAYVLIAERSGGVAAGEHVARDAVVSQQDGGGRGAVVDLVLADGADRQVALRDVGGRRRRGVRQRVVGRGTAAEGNAAGRDR